MKKEVKLYKQCYCHACEKVKPQREFMTPEGAYDICGSCRKLKKRARKVGVGEIHCPSCGMILTVDAFYEVNGKYQTPCKECKKRIRRERYQRDRSKELESVKKRYKVVREKRKAEMKEYYRENTSYWKERYEEKREEYIDRAKKRYARNKRKRS